MGGGMKVLAFVIGILLFLMALLFAIVWYFISLPAAVIAVCAAALFDFLAVKLIWWRIKRGLDRMAGSLTAALTGEVTLQPRRRRRGWHKPACAKLAKELEAKGFSHAGFFKLKDQDFYIEGLVNPALSAYAVIYDTPHNEPYVDVATLYKDGGSFTCTSAPRMFLIGPRKPDMPIDCLEGAGVKKLAGFFVRARPDGEFAAVSKDGFKEHFEGTSRRAYEWLLEQARETAALEEALHAEFLRGTGMDGERFEEERDCYFFVHDRLQPALVAARLGLAESISAYGGGETPVELVERALAADAAGFTVAAKLDAPAAAYVLLFPEEAEVDVIEVDDELA